MTNRQDILFLMEAIVARLVDTHVFDDKKFFDTFDGKQVYVEKKLLEEYIDHQRGLDTGYISIELEGYTLNHHGQDLEIELHYKKDVIEFSFTDEIIQRDLQNLFNTIYALGNDNGLIVFKNDKKYKIVEIE